MMGQIFCADKYWWFFFFSLCNLRLYNEYQFAYVTKDDFSDTTTFVTAKYSRCHVAMRFTSTLMQLLKGRFQKPWDGSYFFKLNQILSYPPPNWYDSGGAVGFEPTHLSSYKRGPPSSSASLLNRWARIVLTKTKAKIKPKPKSARAIFKS